MSYFIIGMRERCWYKREAYRKRDKKSRKKYKIMQEVSQKRSIQEEG